MASPALSELDVALFEAQPVGEYSHMSAAATADLSAMNSNFQPLLLAGSDCSSAPRSSAALELFVRRQNNRLFALLQNLQSASGPMDLSGAGAPTSPGSLPVQITSRPASAAASSPASSRSGRRQQHQQQQQKQP